jgi:hypothetical protein
VKNEDTDMIRLFTSMDTLVQLTKRLPTANRDRMTRLEIPYQTSIAVTVCI